LLDLARRLRKITRGTETLFFMNDRPDLALLAEADGVHLGQHDLSVAEARRIVGGRMLIGRSTHNLAQLRRALREPPDYVAIGPVFATQSKQNPDPVLGLDRARRMLGACSIPAVAIGGISSERLRDVLAAGFRSYALIGEVGQSATP